MHMFILYQDFFYYHQDYHLSLSRAKLLRLRSQPMIQVLAINEQIEVVLALKSSFSACPASNDTWNAYSFKRPDAHSCLFSVWSCDSVYFLFYILWIQSLRRRGHWPIGDTSNMPVNERPDAVSTTNKWSFIYMVIVWFRSHRKRHCRCITSIRNDSSMFCLTFVRCGEIWLTLFRTCRM